jgi:hypothetical protein
MAFPGSSLGCAESTSDRLAGEPGAAQRELRAFDEEHYVAGRGALALAGVQALPSRGASRSARMGTSSSCLFPAGGHTGDGCAYWLPWLQVLVRGDYLSPVEIPMISSGGSLESYVATLERLAPLVDEALTVVPGHGGAIDREVARRTLDERGAFYGARESRARDPFEAPFPSGPNDEWRFGSGCQN